MTSQLTTMPKLSCCCFSFFWQKKNEKTKDVQRKKRKRTLPTHGHHLYKKILLYYSVSVKQPSAGMKVDQSIKPTQSLKNSIKSLIMSL